MSIRVASLQLFVLAWLASFIALAQVEPAPSSRLRPEQFWLSPTTGGSATFSLPFTKSWGELTEQQQDLFRRYYESMPARDEPPFPLGGLSSLYDPIAKAQAKALIEGRFSADLSVDSSGLPTSITVFRTPSPAVTKLVANIAMLTKFKPALCQGSPCSGSFPLVITFELR